MVVIFRVTLIEDEDGDQRVITRGSRLYQGNRIGGSSPRLRLRLAKTSPLSVVNNHILSVISAINVGNGDVKVDINGFPFLFF